MTLSAFGSAIFFLYGKTETTSLRSVSVRVSLIFGLREGFTTPGINFDSLFCDEQKLKDTALGVFNFWRRERDSNPRTSVSSLHDFQSCAFDQLGHLCIYSICFVIISNTYPFCKYFYQISTFVLFSFHKQQNPD